VDFEREGAAETLVSRYSTLRLFYLLLMKKNYDNLNRKMPRKIVKANKISTSLLQAGNSL